MENYEQTKWISNNFQEHDIINRLSIKAREELTKIFKDNLSKMNISQTFLISFWLSIEKTCPTGFNEAVKLLLTFI